jgi:hypothetical protein
VHAPQNQWSLSPYCCCRFDLAQEYERH